MMGDVTTMARVEIERALFVEEIKRLARGGRRNAGEAIVSYGEEGLIIAAGGGETRLPATGRWPGEARVLFSWLVAMAKMPPAMDPLVLEVRQGRLRMGGSSVRCQWQRKDAAEVQLPVNAGWIDLLRAGLEHDEATLEKSGLLKQVQQARRKQAMVLLKAFPLFNEFGVTIDDLEKLVQTALLRQ